MGGAKHSALHMQDGMMLRTASLFTYCHGNQAGFDCTFITQILESEGLLFSELTPLFNSKNLYKDLDLYTSTSLPLSFRLDVALCSQSIEEGGLVLTVTMQ